VTNKAQRQPYLDQVRAENTAQRLREQVGWISLCGWCRYFYDPGPSYEYPDEDNTDCDHPQAHDVYGPNFSLIRRARVNTERVSEGADCWAFRPKAGASDSRFRDTSPDLRYPMYAHRQVPGARLVELMALSPEDQEEIRPDAR
jgi:hypothetical protein